MPSARDFHDGRDDQLIPLESLRLDQVDTFADLVRAMARTASGGRSGSGCGVSRVQALGHATTAVSVVRHHTGG